MHNQKTEDCCQKENMNNSENEFKNASCCLMNHYWQQEKKKLRNVFNNNMSTDSTLSKTEISKIIQSGGFLGSL